MSSPRPLSANRYCALFGAAFSLPRAAAGPLSWSHRPIPTLERKQRERERLVSKFRTRKRAVVSQGEEHKEDALKILRSYYFVVSQFPPTPGRQDDDAKDDESLRVCHR